MRPLLLVLVPCLVLAGAVLSVRAVAEDPTAPTPETLLRRVQALELEVQYLRARDAAVTAYLLDTQDRAHALSQSLKTARDEGFTQGAFSSTSREALLGGLEAHAVNMTKDLPEVSKEQKDLLDRAQRLR